MTKEGSLEEARDKQTRPSPYRACLTGLRSLLVFGFLALLLPATARAWDEGFNFRATSGYVTDGTDETYVLKDAYPTTRAGVTFGWGFINNDATRDRDSAVDRRLAGVNQTPNDGNQADFQVDLPSTGDYTICVALGDAVNAQGYEYLQVKDNTTTLFTIDKSSGVAGAEFYDATGTLYSNAAWPGSQTCVTHTFATTTFKMLMGTSTAQSGSSGIAHLRIYSVATIPDYFCGVDTNFDGSVSNACQAVSGVTDADHDGWASASKVGPFGTGQDCDDTNFWIQPGFETASGCTAGNYRTCQTDGTYTACAAISAFTCHTANGATYWVDDGETDCTGAGTYADPEDWRCWSDTGMSGYHALGDGDCLVFQPGTYSSTWTDSSTVRQFYVNNKDGSSAHPIVIRGEPGAIPGYSGKVEIQAVGTSPTAVFPFYVIGSDYVRIKGFEVDGTGGFSGQGIIVDGSLNPEISLNYVHDVDGENDNNTSCITTVVATSGAYAHHNIVRDCCEQSGCTQQNNMQIRSMDDPGAVRFWYNIIPNVDTVGGGIDVKHAEDTATFSVIGNFIRNVDVYAIGSENKDTTIQNNWMTDCTAYAVAYKGIGDTNAWFKDASITYNTIEDCGFISAPVSSDDMAASGHTLAGTTTILSASQNIVSDSTTTYNSECDVGIYQHGGYSSDVDYAATRGGKFVLNNNIYYNTGNICFGDYAGTTGAANNDGTSYSSLALWQAAGYDTNSVNANPSLDSDGISATYATYGWASGGVFSDSAPASTGGTSGRGAIFQLLKRRM